MGRMLADQRIKADQVLGLPRGGVVTAAEVARILKLPLDVLVVRKIGHPHYREFAVGALAEGGVVVLDRLPPWEIPLFREELEAVIAEEKERLRAYQERFHGGRELDLAGRRVIIVDDGLATGATAEAAVAAARRLHTEYVTVAAPVASPNAVERLERVADAVIVLVNDPDFVAVGGYYGEFPPTLDEEVLKLLRAFGPRKD